MTDHAQVDAMYLDEIAQLLDGNEWTVEMLDRIAEMVRATGRLVREVNPDFQEPGQTRLED